MKTTLLFIIGITVLTTSLAYSQGPCGEIGLSDQTFSNLVTQTFPSGQNYSVLVNTKQQVCARVQNGPGNFQQITFGQFLGDGGIIRVIIYSGTTANNQTEIVDRTFFQGDAPATYSFNPNTTYGVSISYLSAGNFSYEYKKGQGSSSVTTQVTITEAAAPVTWTRDLTYQSAGEQIELNWSVAEQVDVAGYELEKMVPGGSFEKLSEIAYRENGALEVDYSVRTARPTVGSYYRIKQLDYAGTFDYSNVLFVPGHDAAVEEFDVFPNPVSDFARMSVPATVTSVELISLAGRIVRSVPAAEVRREGMDVRDLVPGVYLVRPVSGSERSVTRRIVVNH